MKKSYETPSAEKIQFQYQEQVLASNATCQDVWVNVGFDACTDGNAHWESLN